MASFFDQFGGTLTPPNYTGGSTGNTGVTGGGVSGPQPGAAPTAAMQPGMFPISTIPGQPGGPTPTPGAQGAGGPITMQQFNEAWMGSPYPGTVQGLKDFMAAHPEYAAAGITLGGSKGDKVMGPGGVYWGDYVIGAGTPGGGTGKSVGNGQTGGGAAGSAPGAGGTGGVVPPDYLAPYGTPYAIPTLEELQSSPGYQARLKEGLNAVETSAFAKGTGLTGGTLKKLNRFGQDYASNEANNYFAQKYAVNQGNSGLWYANQSNPYTKLSDLSKIGFPQ